MFCWGHVISISDDKTTAKVSLSNGKAITGDLKIPEYTKDYIKIGSYVTCQFKKHFDYSEGRISLVGK
jgi:hypothetical protein